MSIEEQSNEDGVISQRHRSLSLSFTNPKEVSSNDDSFTIDDLVKSPSPRQASVSVSFSSTNENNNSLDYSDDNGSFGMSSPISPVSSQNEDREDKALNETIDLNETVDLNENAEEELVGTSLPEDSQPVLQEDTSACTRTQTSDTSACNGAQTSNSNLRLRNAKGQSALAVSSSNCFLEGMKLLIEKGADLNLKDLYGRTPLHLACENNGSNVHHDCVEYLLQRGADCSIQDVNGRAPLHIAARTGCVQCIHLLLNHGAKADLKNAVGDTALHITAEMGHLACMEALSPEAGYDDDSHSSVESTTPSLLFGRDNSNSDVASSFYQSPREIHTRNESFQSRMDVSSINNEPEVLSYNNLREAMRQNDSGYFTARGSAWVKSKYYKNEKIEEERESRESSSIESSTSSMISNAEGKFEMESESDSLLSKRDKDIDDEGAIGIWLFRCIEIVLQVVLYLLHSLLTSWSRRSKRLAVNQTKPGDASYQFAEPPDHVAEAMERLRRSKQ